MARIPDSEIERLKKRHPDRASGDRLRGRAQADWGEPDGPLSVPRRPHALPRRDARNQSVALPGKCGIAGSTIDWVMRTRGVSFRHAVELLRADHPALIAGDGHVVRKGTTAKLSVAGHPRRRRSANLARCGELLSRDAGELAGSVAVSGEPRPGASGDDRPLPARLCQPQAGAYAAGQEPQGRAPICAAGCRRSASCAPKAATST